MFESAHHHAACEARACLTHHHPASSLMQPPTIDGSCSQQRSNFMSVLPYHVVTDIVALLPFCDRIRCIRVCKAWQALLLEWPGMWHDIEVDPLGPDGASLARYFGRMEGPHVRRVTLRCLSLYRTEQVLRLLMEPHQHPIRSLGLYECDIPIEHFVQLLQAVGGSLASLVLYETDFTLAMLLRMLRVCPDLESLHFQFGRRYAAPPLPAVLGDDMLPDRLPRLRRLVLSNGGSQPPLDVLLQHCPRTLQLLWVDPDDYKQDRAWPLRLLQTSLLDGVETFCYMATDTMAPSSKCRGGSTTPHLDDNDRVAGYHQQRQGLPGMIIQSSGWLDDRTLLPLLTKRRQPTQVLALGQCPHVTSNSLCKLLAAPGTSLTRLELDKADMVTTAHLITLIKQSPLLHTVRLRRMQSVTDGVLDALSEALRLVHVDLSHCGSITDAALKRFIDKQQGQVKTIDTIGCTAITYDAVSYCWCRMGFR